MRKMIKEMINKGLQKGNGVVTFNAEEARTPWPQPDTKFFTTGPIFLHDDTKFIWITMENFGNDIEIAMTREAVFYDDDNYNINIVRPSGPFIIQPKSGASILYVISDESNGYEYRLAFNPNLVVANVLAFEFGGSVIAGNTFYQKQLVEIDPTFFNVSHI